MDIKLKFIDIGANLIDPMYDGIYNQKQSHPPDRELVLQRAKRYGLHKIIVTAGNLLDSRKALEMVMGKDDLYTTVGVHPTHCSEFLSSEHGGPDSYLEKLMEIAKKGKSKIVAIGEFGLDYDRTSFCPIDVQKKYFEFQFSLAEKTGLPLFLHLRNASEDFISILRRNRHKFNQGVVHSFDGTKEELKQLLDLNLYIGLNGCSLKTEENLEVARLIPSKSLMIETDAPWCQIRPSHAGGKKFNTKFSEKPKEKWQPDAMVKGRNEPANIIQVLEVLAEVRQESITTLAETIYQNTMMVFFPNKEVGSGQNIKVGSGKNIKVGSGQNIEAKVVPVAFTWIYGGSVVCLAGTFNGWEPEIMEKNGNYFVKVVEVEPGVHSFKFVVDGVWLYDLGQQNMEDGCGNWNNFVSVEVTN